MRSATLLPPLLLALLTVSSSAAADDAARETCRLSHEQAQRLRNWGKLIEARAALLVCARPVCSATAQKDCAEWLNEVERDLPTVVFDVTGRDGKPLLTPVIEVDGEPLTTSLTDGKPYPVNPGRRTFVIRDGDEQRTVEELVTTGEKNHRVRVTFEPPPEHPPARIDGEGPQSTAGTAQGTTRATTTSARPASSASVPIPAQRDFRGFYLTAGGAALIPTSHPDLFAKKPFEVTGASSGAFFGGRAGWRLSEYAGIELMVEYGAISGPQNGAGDYAYTLKAVHTGPVARFMSPGNPVRFVGTVGGGFAIHMMTYDEGFTELATEECGDPMCPSAGVDWFLINEVGVEVAIVEGLFLGVSAALYLSGTSGVDDFNDAIPESAFRKPYGNAVLPLFGPRLYLGYGFW